MIFVSLVVFFQAEDGIRDLVRSRGLGDVYKRQLVAGVVGWELYAGEALAGELDDSLDVVAVSYTHLTLPTSDLV